MRCHAGVKADMEDDTRKYGGSGAHEHAKAAGGVHWGGKTVGGIIAAHTHLLQPGQEGDRKLNLRRLQI